MSSKTEKKKQNKVIQDRTFGLKNKNKSKAVQKYVKGVQTQVKNGCVSANKLQSEQFQRRKQRKKQEQQAALLNSLYQDVNRLKEQQSQQEDPANTVCPYFKQGLCQKGKKCIYSHDLTLDRTQEIDLYVDQRTQLIMNALGGKQLSELTQQQLSKHIGQKQKQMIKGCRSDIVCKFFLQAVQKDKYGWNWSCPNNGDKCKYKHCLPPGYKLKRDGGNVIEQDKIDIQEKIDQQRNKLIALNKSSPLVTYEVFLKWKQDRRLRKQAEQIKKKQQQQKKNKGKVQLRTGRQLFTYDPTLFVDDEQAAAEYQQEEIVEEQQEAVEEKQQNLEQQITQQEQEHQIQQK